MLEVVDGKWPVSQLERGELRVVGTKRAVGSHVSEATPLKCPRHTPRRRAGA